MKQKATQLIRDNAPWLKELSFGCEVQPFNNLRKNPIPRLISFDGKIAWHEVGGSVGKSKCSLGDIRIIGHPITIGDVLRVMEPKGMKTMVADRLINLDLEQEDVRYNLTQPFDNQSNEFYAFIVELLCKKS